MDEKFQPAMAAIESGRLERLARLIQEDPTLATDRSSEGHPSLLQCLVIDGQGVLKRAEMAEALIEAGADVDGPLIAAGGVDNVEVLEALIAAGGAVNGNDDWSPLEEALYWNVPCVIESLVKHGAGIKNLRMAAGLGHTELVIANFADDGTLLDSTESVSWPFGPIPESRSPTDPVNIVNNALVYACSHGHADTAEALLDRGAQVDAIPPGFHYAATSLHYAALHGHLVVAERLVSRGADLTIRDKQVRTRAEDWAHHGGHFGLASYLKNAGTEDAST
jgi:uncharacterized protein